MRRGFSILVTIASMACGSCATPIVDFDPNAESDVQAAPVSEEDVSAPQRPVAECDPAAEQTGCPEGLFCETTARVCVECVTDIVRCTEDGEREQCLRPVSTGLGELEGGVFEPMPCEALHVCVPADATSATCEYELCTPGLMRCISPTVAEECNVYGTAFDAELCGPGWACAGGACEPIRHNVLLIFDTSTSMFEFSEGSGYPDDDAYVYPTCEADSLPMTRFDLAKTIFAENIVEAVGEFSHFALQRFPQRPLTGRVPTCVTGYYLSAETDMMSGDDGTIDTTSVSWFTEHRDEVLVAPFATSLSIDNTQQLLRWLDFEESLQATTQGCSRHDDCPSGGCLPDAESQTNRCFQHDEPELRMGGNTPLGKSLFYAGEYFRRSVLIDGKACDGDLDCPSAGYVCDEGACRDPYASCRDNQIVLFTDGEENLFQGKDEFFGPQAQAKRLAFGLHCEEDSDCRGGASCVVSFDVGYCVPPGDSISGAPFLPETGYDALSRPDGTPISIRTTVVNLRTNQASVANPNATIARWGGGELVEVFSEHPESMKEQLYEVMTPAFKCEPEELLRDAE